MSRIILSLIGALALMPGLTMAQTTSEAQQQQSILVGSGATGGTYNRLIAELNQACSKVLPIQNWTNSTGGFSSGSVESLGLVMRNQAELGVVQTDILHLTKNTEAPGTTAASSVNALVTVMTFHAEEIHLVARSAPLTEGGVNLLVGRVNTQTVNLNTINDLKGRKVGAWGGSVLTARVINSNASTGLDIVEYNNQKEALDALRNGKVDTILAVGGQPLAWVTQLNRDEFKLLEIPAQTANQLQAVYRTASIIYPNLGATVGVPTVSVDALLVARAPRGRNRIKAYTDLRTCLADNIDDIRETRGTHPKWQEIEPGREARWPMFQPPASR